MEEKKLFLLDAYALIYRAYYALLRAPRVTSNGLNTSAIFGFVNTLDEILRKENPGYIAVCFDPKGGHTFRHEAYPEYKAQREKQPEDITVAVPYIKRILEAYRIPVVEVEGFEADDVIGTLAHQAEREGFTTYMMTPDKDYGQLVTDKVFMYRPALKGQGFEVRGPQQVCELYGLSNTSQVIDFLALEGDASDNVPGCPGVGPKTATKLLKEYGTVENLIEHASEIKGALGTKIAENVEQIKFSKFLVTIKTDVPLDITPEALIRKEPDTAALVEVYKELEFRSMAAKLGASIAPTVAPSVAEDAQPQSKSDDGMGSLFDLPDETPSTEVGSFDAVGYRIISDAEEIRAFIKNTLQQGRYAIALHLDGTEAMTATLLGLAVAQAKGNAAYIAIPVMGSDRDDIIDIIKPLFNTADKMVVSHDVKRDMIVLRRLGIDFTAKYYDTAVAHYVIAPETSHLLSTVAMLFLNYKTLDYDFNATERKNFRLTDTDTAMRHLCEAADVCLQLVDVLNKKIAEDGLSNLLNDIELPFVSVLASMEYEGVRIDTAELAAMSRRLTLRLDSLQTEAYKLAGHAFNISSPKQVGEVLFGELEIDPKARKTKNGAWSTTEDVLEKYRHKHPLVDIILEVRGVNKLLSTYVDALPKLINRETGKIHTTFNQTVTATGRISSTNPNLQNIPVRTDDGREIRRAFIPDEGNVMLSADYSQIELRLMADISGDPEMIEAFREGEDIHRATAAKIYGVSPDEVTDEQRRNAKTANFGIIYGISAFGLAERLAIPRSEAKELIEGYFRTYPRIREYISETIDLARENGYVTTVKGRKRYLPDINSRNATVRGYAERNAVNAPLQGSAADIIKIAMINIQHEMMRLNMRSRMIMQVHDELIFNVVPDEADTLQALVERLMQGAYSGKVSLTVASALAPNWLEAH
jgi:DNA polymerase-1